MILPCQQEGNVLKRPPIIRAREDLPLAGRQHTLSFTV
jgi:hypothetical protein